MNNINQYYEILGLKPGVSLEEVKQAYKDLAMVWHPDRFPNNPRLKEKAQEELKRINEAYEVLKSGNFSSSNQASSPQNESPRSVDEKTYYEQGMEKARKGRYKEAIEDFNYAIRMNPYDAEAYKYRGLARSKLGDKQKAFYDFKQVTALYLKQGNTHGYHHVLELIKKLPTSKLFTTVRTDYRKLQELLLAGKWQEADRETFAIMLKVAGREKEGWLREKDIKNFSCTHLHIIDQLWVIYSNGVFGFSVQRRIWQGLGSTNQSNHKTWCDFCDRVYWRVKYNGQWANTWVPYNNFVFDLDAPTGHLPAALPGRGYSDRLVSVICLVVMLLCGLIDISSHSDWSKLLLGAVGVSIVALCNAGKSNQKYTHNWWKHLFSRLQACEL